MIAAVVVSGGIFVVLYVIRVGLPFPLIVSTVLAVMVVHGALLLVRDDPLPAEVTGRGVAGDRRRTICAARSRRSGTRSHRPTGSATRSTAGTTGSAGASATSAGSPRIVLPRLADLIDERLRQRHGFTAKADPERARAVLGERPVAVHDPAGHPRGRRRGT